MFSRNLGSFCEGFLALLFEIGVSPRMLLVVIANLLIDSTENRAENTRQGRLRRGFLVFSWVTLGIFPLFWVIFGGFRIEKLG